jgi:hypothetical protein
MNWAISKYDDAILKLSTGIRLNMGKLHELLKETGTGKSNVVGARG